MNADVVISLQGTIVLFDLLTPAAESWVEEHVDPDAQWFAGALVAEHRCAGDIAAALQQDGLAVEVL